MDKYYENRFGYYRENNNEELEKERTQIIDEIEYLLKILNSKTASSEQKSEIRNSDLKFERDKLELIDKVLEERNNKRSIKK